MKKIYLVGLIPLVLLLSISGCSLFGPLPGDIMGWLPKLTTASTLSYRISGTYSEFGKTYYGEDSPTPSTENYSVLEATYDSAQSKIVLREQSGYRLFIIADDNRGMIFLSDDEYADIYDDTVMIKTPVKVGTTWTSDYYGMEARFSVQEVNATYTTGAGTFKKVVIVNIAVIDPDYEQWADVIIKGYWDPSAGYLGYTRTYPENDPNSNWQWLYTTVRYELSNFVP